MVKQDPIPRLYQDGQLITLPMAPFAISSLSACQLGENNMQPFASSFYYAILQKPWIFFYKILVS